MMNRKRIKFQGRNFSVEIAFEKVDKWGLKLWVVDKSTHEGRYLAWTEPETELPKVEVKLRQWDDFLDKGVGANERIIIKQKREYIEEKERRQRYARKMEALRQQRK